MKSVDRLVAEHDIMERGLNVHEKSVVLIESDQPIPEGFFHVGTGFLQPVRRQVPQLTLRCPEMNWRLVIEGLLIAGFTAYFADLGPRRRFQSPSSIAPASQNRPGHFENCSRGLSVLNFRVAGFARIRTAWSFPEVWRLQRQANPHLYC